MRVIGINGSARRDGNTALLIKAVFAPLEEAGVETEFVQLAGAEIRGCKGCGACLGTQNGRCATDDLVNTCIAKMLAADGIILGSPTYFTDVSAEMKALIDRAGMVAMANGSALRRKAGACVVAVRRGGATHAFDTMNHFMLINQMLLVGSTYWNMGYGWEAGDAAGDAAGDEEGMQNMGNLGENMAWLLGRIVGS